jgi:hypothetical protein
MEQQQTCGQGLAQNAALNAKLAEVFSAVAEVLEIHLTSLDPKDKGSRPEFDAYVALATEYRELESRVRALAMQMEGYRDLPMAVHDMAVLTSQGAKQALEQLITEKQGLAVLLQDWVKQYSLTKTR